MAAHLGYDGVAPNEKLNLDWSKASSWPGALMISTTDGALVPQHDKAYLLGIRTTEDATTDPTVELSRAAVARGINSHWSPDSNVFPDDQVMVVLGDLVPKEPIARGGRKERSNSVMVRSPTPQSLAIHMGLLTLYHVL